MDLKFCLVACLTFTAERNSLDVGVSFHEQSVFFMLEQWTICFFLIFHLSRLFQQCLLVTRLTPTVDAEFEDGNFHSFVSLLVSVQGGRQ